MSCKKIISDSTISEYGRSNFSNTTMCSRYLGEYDKTGNSNHKQRILLIDVNCKNSSTGKIVYDLYQSIRADGREASICYGRGEKIVEDSIYKFGLDWETYLHAALSRITGYNGCFSAISTRRLINYIEQFKPDIIHIHELHAYFVNIKPLIDYIKSHNIPLIWTFHCEYMYTGKCGYAFECDGFRNYCGNCPAVNEYPKSLFFDRTRKMLTEKRRLLQDMDFQIITPSQWLLDRVRMSFLKDKPVSVIFNGVDTGVFHPREDVDVRSRYGISNESKMILMVANNAMSDVKGGKYIFEICKRTDLHNAEFVIVGASNDDIKQLKTERDVESEDHVIIDFFESSNRVHVLSLIYDQIELACLYTAADLLLLPSKKETFSMPCAEALCCGTRVVGFECGAPETIFKQPQAKFVPYGDIDALATAINQAISD